MSAEFLLDRCVFLTLDRHSLYQEVKHWSVNRKNNKSIYKYAVIFYIRCMSKEWLASVPNYFERYVDLVQEEDVMTALHNSETAFLEWGAKADESKANYAYDEGKWTTNQVLLHIVDVERIFQYRSLCIARGEMNGLPGFDHDNYAVHSEANKRSIQSIMTEFTHVRNSSISLFENMEKSRMKFKGMANGLVVQPVLYGFLMTGHLRHHLNVLETRY